MLRATLFAFVTLCFVAFAGPAQAAFPAQQLGAYSFAGNKAQKQKRKAAIKKIASSVNFFFRGRVERSLRKVFAIRATILVRQRKGKVAVSKPGGKTFFTAVSGKVSTFKTRKGLLLLTRRAKANTLRERLQLKGKKGFRVHRYVFSKDGKTLTLHTKAYLAKLKKTLRFVLTYKKK